MTTEPKASLGRDGAKRSALSQAADLQSVAMWMGFAASVIKSGEPWTDQCQREYDEAKAAFARIAAAPVLAVEVREKIARLIDPMVFQVDEPRYRDTATKAERRCKALLLADAILSTITGDA